MIRTPFKWHNPCRTAAAGSTYSGDDLWNAEKRRTNAAARAPMRDAAIAGSVANASHSTWPAASCRAVASRPRRSVPTIGASRHSHGRGNCELNKRQHGSAKLPRVEISSWSQGHRPEDGPVRQFTANGPFCLSRRARCLSDVLHFGRDISVAIGPEYVVEPYRRFGGVGLLP